MLTERQLRLFARQIIVRELGQVGQARLCASHAISAAQADPGAARVALDYLRRAGLQVREPGAEVASDASSAGPATQAPFEIPIATTTEVARVAGIPELTDCAQWLLGAWAAVEAIKRCVGVGDAAASPGAGANSTAELTLDPEHS